MKLRVRSSQDLHLNPGSRAVVEKRIRLAIGIRANEIESLQLELRLRPNSPRPIRCCVSMICSDGARSRLEEDAESIQEAVDWAAWRVRHALGRHSLRTYPR